MSQYSIQARARILKRLGLPGDLSISSGRSILWNPNNWTPEIIAAHARHIADHRANNPYFEKTFTGEARNPLNEGFYPEDLTKPQAASPKTEEKPAVSSSQPTIEPAVVPAGIPKGADKKTYGYFKDDGSLETDPVKIAAAMSIVYKGAKAYYNDNGTERSRMVDTDLPSLVYKHPTSKASVEVTARRAWRNKENPGYFLSKDREEGGDLYDNADYGNRLSVSSHVDNVRTAYPEKQYNYAPITSPLSTVPMKDGTPEATLHASEFTEDLLRTHYAPRAAAIIAARHEILNSKANGDTKNTAEEDTRIYNAGNGYSAEAQPEEEPMPQPQSDMFGKMLQAAEDYPAPSSQLDGSSNVGQQFKDLTSEEEAAKEETTPAPTVKPLTCTFCGETSPDEESFKRDHQIFSNGWCKSVVDAHNALNPKFPINVQ